MIRTLLNIWKVPELRWKIAFTLGMLAIYRIGFFIPLPGVNQEALREWAENAQGNAVGNLISFVGMFTGGTLGQSTIFGLGIMPYISAAIIFQLLTASIDSFKELQKQGVTGRQKIQEYTRYAAVGLCLVQASFFVSFIQRSGLVYPEYAGTMLFWLCGVVGLTTGTMFLMWLGEQIDKYGIGNGVSLIITAGIIAGIPGAVTMILSDFSFQGDATYGFGTIVFLALSFVLVVAGAIVITQAQRRIPVQQAKHTRGRKVYGGQRSYLPLRVNHGGVMPIIFASSLMIFPTILFPMIENYLIPTRVAAAEGEALTIWQTIGNTIQVSWYHISSDFLAQTGYLYSLTFIGLIFFFAYFWTTVQFQPKEMATQLRDAGSFIPGLRPGPRTAEYLETVMERITYVGAGFLAVIAVIPTIVAANFEIPFMVTQYLGGTGLLIVVSVMLDLVQRIEATLLMRNYEGFLSQSGSGGQRSGGRRSPKIRGPRGSTA
ncbi:preprotein translocase subunit SecY [Mucisphaera calidilacus]|uniref:Protein translocase subunit SecY n=1 Tax=Mucisphaera calidilacus TaxID=2527982 RepID=A0A518BXP9_9BACT|nr:preprotein translocase subunit SecY [Mucisphaera calidilacus]QDU71757.1 Protein translocase subunit SecY [Mucisphaera calidilacus]